MSRLQIRGLRMAASRAPGAKEILRGVDLDLVGGEITGVAGESGSGKTMTGLSVLGLQPANTRVSGQIHFHADDSAEPVDVLRLSKPQLNRLRGNRIAMVFQDPTSSLHPMLSIGTQLTDHLRHHQRLNRRQALARAAETLAEVHVPEPELALKKYPHQFSGGQLQRIAIASAIICEPEVLIADEPTTALDVTVQAGLLHLLRRLCDERSLAIMLITHDLGVMSALADTIAVMRSGEVVEFGARHQVITAPKHEYTRGLIESLPAAHLPDEAGDVDE